ncbi:MAG: ribonuclease Z [Desulfobacterales bacterium]|nr:ribonuclease Z [Desulfobacterales bacterium]
MRPSFCPRLVNGPFGDPGLFIPLLFENRAIQFDLGDISALVPRDILKISHVFVTHTHMDHFVGFDRLLRVCLGRDKIMHLYGPEGFLENVKGKLRGYSWNLVGNYPNRFVLKVTEIGRTGLKTQNFDCQKEFKPGKLIHQQGSADGIYREDRFAIRAVLLDHRIPCIGYAIEERFHINIISEALIELGLEVGPWLNTFKRRLYQKKPPDFPFDIPSVSENTSGKSVPLGFLADRIAKITPGHKITYIVDVTGSNANVEKIIDFAKDSEHLFIEAAFADKDRDLATAKNHLTARQAGRIAAAAKVKQFSIFHFSPRYADCEDVLRQEAHQAFSEAQC